MNDRNAAAALEALATAYAAELALLESLDLDPRVELLGSGAYVLEGSGGLPPQGDEPLVFTAVNSGDGLVHTPLEGGAWTATLHGSQSGDCYAEADAPTLEAVVAAVFRELRA